MQPVTPPMGLARKYDDPIVGTRFGRYTVIGLTLREAKRRRVPVECDCGNQKFVDLPQLHTRPGISCGCARRERMRDLSTTHGDSQSTGPHFAIYARWRDMVARCTHPGHHAYGSYGGRGITVCSTWAADYVSFRTWALENGYAPKLHIDRRDNDQGYSPDNCRWVTAKVNNNNRRTTVFVVAFGKRQTLTEWLVDPRCVVQRGTLVARLKSGWAPELALSTLAGSRNREVLLCPA
jgi:hypothetical protein